MLINPSVIEFSDADALAVLLGSRWGLKSWGPTGYGGIVARWSPTMAEQDQFVTRLAVPDPCKTNLLDCPRCH